MTNLEQIQHRAMRFILRKKFTEYECLSKLNLLSLQYHRVIHDLVFFFKWLKNIHDLDIFDHVLFCSCNKPLRDIDY